VCLRFFADFRCRFAINIYLIQPDQAKSSLQLSKSGLEKDKISVKYFVDGEEWN